jgi:hypothetical protein
MLTLKEVEHRIDAISAEQGDPEAAHGLEDTLYRDVLNAIADGHPDPAVIAALCLMTRHIDFPRWCA